MFIMGITPHFLFPQNSSKGSVFALNWHNSAFSSLSCHKVFLWGSASVIHRSGSLSGQGLGWMVGRQDILCSLQANCHWNIRMHSPFFISFSTMGQQRMHWTAVKCLQWIKQWAWIYLWKFNSLCITGTGSSVTVVIMSRSTCFVCYSLFSAFVTNLTVRHPQILCVEHCNKQKKNKENWVFFIICCIAQSLYKHVARLFPPGWQ